MAQSADEVDRLQTFIDSVTDLSPPARNDARNKMPPVSFVGRCNHSKNPTNEERRDDIPVSQGDEVGFMDCFLLNRKVYNRGGRAMQQRKFMSWGFTLFMALLVMFVSGQATAGPTSCTATNAVGETITVQIVNDPVQGFPMYFADNNADTANYCGNRTNENYPCTVFRYMSKGYLNAQQLFATIPYCPNTQLDVRNTSAAYSLCNTGAGNNQSFHDIYACNMRGIWFPNGGGSGNGTEHYFEIPIKTPPGTTVGMGVNSMILADIPSTFYPCRSNAPENYSGIIGPSCYQELPQPPICDAPSPGSSGTTTNTCLPNVGGRVLKLDVQDEAIEAVYQCPTGDFSCASSTCIPSDTTSCSPSTTCVKQETYEVEMTLFDENGNEIPGGGKFGIQEVGGTVEEAIGYFVLTDGDPTIYCLSGVGGNTICVCSGTLCPAQ